MRDARDEYNSLPSGELSDRARSATLAVRDAVAAHHNWSIPDPRAARAWRNGRALSRPSTRRSTVRSLSKSSAPTTEELYHRFTREARSAGRLQHPNIVTVYDVGEHDGQPFIAMEYIAGQTLAQVIAEGSALVADAQARAGRGTVRRPRLRPPRGIVHRDIKPSNLMINPDGLLKILDFGIARVADSGHTQAGAMIGTPNYMSPEQVRGQGIDLRSDVFAVGLVFYELLSYRQAFPGDSPFTVVQQILTDQPAPLGSLLPGLSTGIVRIVDRALEKAPERRYQDLDLMRKDIGRARESLSGASLEDTAIITLPHKQDGLGGSGVAPWIVQVIAPHAAPRRAGPAPCRTDRRAPAARRERARRRDNWKKRSRPPSRPSSSTRTVSGRWTASTVSGPRSMRGRCANGSTRRKPSWARARSHLPSPSSLASSSWIPRRRTPSSSGSAIVEARQRKEREAERLRQFQSLLARAKEALDKNEPAAALRAATEALQADPASTIAKDLHSKAEVALRAYLDREAHAAIDQARKRFASGAHDEALAALASYSPEHPAVDAALTELRAELERSGSGRLKRPLHVAAQKRSTASANRPSTPHSERSSPRSDPRSSTMRRRGSRRLRRTKGWTRRGKAELERARILLAERMALAKKRAAIEKFLAEARESSLPAGDFVKARAKVDAALALDAEDAARQEACDGSRCREAGGGRASAGQGARRPRGERGGERPPALCGRASRRRARHAARVRRRASGRRRGSRRAGRGSRNRAEARARRRGEEAAGGVRRRPLPQRSRMRERWARTANTPTPSQSSRHSGHSIPTSCRPSRSCAWRPRKPKRSGGRRRFDKREEATRAALAEAEDLAGKGEFDAALDCVDAALVENPTSTTGTGPAPAVGKSARGEGCRDQARGTRCGRGSNRHCDCARDVRARRARRRTRDARTIQPATRRCGRDADGTAALAGRDAPQGRRRRGRAAGARCQSSHRH